MNDDIFFGKIIVNALGAWSGGFGDEGVLRSIMDNNEYLHGVWSEMVNRKKEERIKKDTEELGFKMSFIQLSKLVSSEDIRGIIEEIRATVPEINKEFALSNSTKILADLLDLTPAEAIVLEASSRLYEGIDYELYRTVQRIADMEKLNHKETLMAQLYGITKEEATGVLNGFLVKSGFLVETRGPNGFYNLNADIAPIFSIQNLDPNKIEETLFPAAIKTDLSVADFPHIEKEIGLCKNSIDNALATKGIGMNVLLWGEPGTGKSELALAMANEYGWNLRIVGDTSSSDTSEKSRSARLASLKLATKLLARDERAVILFDEIEDIFKTDNNAAFSKAFINRIIETSPVPIIWTTNNLFVMGQAVLRRMIYNIHLEVPPEKTRKRMWEKYSSQYSLGIDEETIASLSETYDISPALIHNSVKVAHSVLRDEERSDNKAITEIISSLDRLVNFGEKRTFAIRRSEEDTYDPSCSNTDRDLNDFTNRLLKAKPNFSLLLYGASGTGKSEFAKFLAKRMGRKVLFKKASDIIDKWVGGTEEKMAKAFEEAKDGNRFLIIDEGDSFLYNRERAEHSWEVTATNQMLTEMEIHDQPFALTTNLKDDIDPAAMRRFTFKLKFDYITPQQSKKLFKTFFGVEAPEEITKLDMLTPGDYANVKKQANILEIDDRWELYNMLKEEVSTKPSGRSPLGF